MHVTSDRRHSLNLSGEMASIKRRTLTHARGRPATRPPAAMQAAAHRRWTLHNAKTTRHPLQPVADALVNEIMISELNSNPG